MKEFDNIELKFRNSEFNSLSSEFLHESEFNPIKKEIDYSKEFSNGSSTEENNQTNNTTNTTNNFNSSKTSSDVSSIQQEIIGKTSALAIGTSMGTAVSALALCVASVGVGNSYSNNNLDMVQVESQYEDTFEESQTAYDALPPTNEILPTNNKEEKKKEAKDVKVQAPKTENKSKDEKEEIKKFEISSRSYEGIYDGREHSGDLQNIPEGAVIKYGESIDKIDLDKVPEYKDAGEYTVYYKVSKEGYEPYIGDFKIKINKKIINPPVPLIEETTYNGKMQSPKFIDDGDFKYFGTMSARDAGTYQIKIKLNNTKNYEWSDGNDEEKTVSWVINPREVTLEWNGKKDYKYDDNKHTVDVVLGNIVPGDFLNFNVEGNSATKPGEYMAEVTSIDGTDNYVLPKKNSFAWSISK
ncbi:MAG TPA: hypothetical protein DG753_00615 [Clostridium sp.]|nr:hypothetical protein [Clostridium sp.]